MWVWVYLFTGIYPSDQCRTILSCSLGVTNRSSLLKWGKLLSPCPWPLDMFKVVFPWDPLSSPSTGSHSSRTLFDWGIGRLAFEWKAFMCIDAAIKVVHWDFRNDYLGMKIRITKTHSSRMRTVLFSDSGRRRFSLQRPLGRDPLDRDPPLDRNPSWTKTPPCTETP